MNNKLIQINKKPFIFELKKHQPENKRNSNIEVLRFILSIFVIFWHYARLPLLTPLLVVPVNVFTMITGYFLIQKKDSFRFLKFFQVLLFLFFINIILNVTVSNIFHFSNKINWKSLFLYGNNTWWYLWAIMFIYILSPLLNYGAKNLNKYSLLFIIVSIWSIFQINGFVKSTYQISNYFHDSIIVLLYCYLIGCFMALHCQTYLENQFRVFIVSIFIMGACLVNHISYLSSKINNPLYDFFYDNHSLLVVFSSFAVFSFVLTIRTKYSRFKSYLGSLSIFIFAYQGFFSEWAYVYQRFDNLIWAFLFILLLTILLAIIIYWPYKWYLKISSKYIFDPLINFIKIKINNSN